MSKIVTIHCPPYGTEQIEVFDETIELLENGRIKFSGVVVEGSETSRLFQHTKTRSTKGETRTVTMPEGAFLRGVYHTHPNL